MREQVLREVLETLFARQHAVRRAQRAKHGADAAAAAVRGGTRNVFFDGVVPS